MKFWARLRQLLVSPERAEFRGAEEHPDPPTGLICPRVGCTEHPTGGAFVLATRISKALVYARFGDEEGEHHKAWVIDQMVRALTGCGDEGESDMYQAFTAIVPLDPGIAP